MMKKTISETELVRLCKRGDRRGQKELFDRFKRMVMGICTRYTPSRESAEDMMQEAFIRIFSHVGELTQPERLAGWVRTIAIRTAIDHWKKSKKTMEWETDLTAVDQAGGDYEQIFASLEEQELLGMLHQLPEHLRLVFNLAAIEGYAHLEVAETLGITELTSRVFLNRARTQLKKQVLRRYQTNQSDNHV